MKQNKPIWWCETDAIRDAFVIRAAIDCNGRTIEVGSVLTKIHIVNSANRINILKITILDMQRKMDNFLESIT